MSDTLTHRTIKNSIYSIVGFVWPLLLSFVATPIIIHGLGSAKFGFFSLLNTMLGVFGLLDFGISYTLVKKLSENRESPGEALAIFSSTFILYAVLGVVVLFLFMLLPGVFRNWFKIPEGYISSFGLAFLILGLVFLINMLIVPLSQIPYALQRTDITVKISLTSITLQQLASIIAIKMGYGILALLVIQLASVAFLLLCFFFSWRRLVPDLKIKFAISRDSMGVIGKQGFWVFVNNVMGNILGQMDKFVVSAFWGPAAVGYYATAQMAPEKIYSTSFSLSHLFFPIFSEAASKQQAGVDRVKFIFRRAMNIIPVITFGLTVVVLAYGYQLIRFWVSKDFADHDAWAIILLAITYFLLSFGSFFNAFLSGVKALKFLAVSSVITAMTDVVFMFIFIPKHSINGASLAYLISGLPVVAYLYFIERRYFHSGRSEIVSFYGKLLTKVILVGGIIYLIAAAILRHFVTNLFFVMLIGGTTFLLYIFVYWLLGFAGEDDISVVKRYIGIIFRRLTGKSA